MMEIMSSEDVHAKHDDNIHMSVMTSGDHHDKKMIFISEDGNITKIDGDEHIWESEDGENIEVIVKKMHDGDHNVKVKKNIIIISDDEKGGKGTWTIEEGDDGEIIMINEDGEKIKMIKKIQKVDDDGKTVEWVSDGDNDDVEVIVIRKSGDDDEEVEVEVTIKEEKVSKKKEGKKKK